MSMNLDKPLDDLIKSNPKRSGRGGNRGARGGRKSGGGAKAAAIGPKAVQAVSAANTAANRNKPLAIPGRAPGGGLQGSKIIVSNFPLDVTEAQVKELFATTIGPLRRIAMSFRANGQSTGQVTVEFQRAEDANRAYQQYNNRMIDGKKAIRVEVVVDPARAAAQAAQVAAVTAPIAARGGRGGAAAARGGRGAAKAGRGGRGGATTGGKAAQRPKKSAEDLDAEMEEYSANKSNEVV